jgi:hypothetical protein
MQSDLKKGLCARIGADPDQGTGEKPAEPRSPFSTADSPFISRTVNWGELSGVRKIEAVEQMTPECHRQV